MNTPDESYGSADESPQGSVPPPPDSPEQGGSVLNLLKRRLDSQSEINGSLDCVPYIPENYPASYNMKYEDAARGIIRVSANIPNAALHCIDQETFLFDLRRSAFISYSTKEPSCADDRFLIYCFHAAGMPRHYWSELVSPQ